MGSSTRGSGPTWAAGDTWSEPGGDAAPDDASRADVPDRYELRTVLGHGGMGRVWLAWDRELEREVAYKEIEEGQVGTRAADRFLREARLTARLDHPGIVPVHDAGIRPDGGLYYVMRVIRGQSLRQALAACGDEAARLGLLDPLIDACQAVAYAHSLEVLHRDLKPDNIMIGALGETQVVDWGLAKALGSGEDDGRSIVGSPRYMSPEQAAGADVDARTDVWALGAILYEILSGRRLFEGPSDRDLVDRVARGEVCIGDMSGPLELRAVAARALSVDPAARYPDASALLVDLKAFRTGRRVSAYHYSPLEEITRLVRRYRWPLAGLSAGLSIAAVIAAGGYWRTAVERDRAQAAELVARRAEGEAVAARADIAKALQDAYVGEAHRATEREDPAAALTWAAAALSLGPDPRARGVAAHLLDRMPYRWDDTRVALPAPCTSLLPRPDGSWSCGGPAGTWIIGDGEPSQIESRPTRWLQMSDDGAWTAMSDGRSWLRIVDGAGTDRYRLDGLVEGLMRPAFHPSGSFALPRARSITVIDPVSGAARWTYHTPSLAGGAAWVGDEVLIWLASGVVRVHDARTGLPRPNWAPFATPGAWHAIFSRDGRRLLFASMGGAVGVLSRDEGERLLRTHGSGATVGWSSDEEAVWSSDVDGVTVWSVDGAPRLRLAPPASGAPFAVGMRDAGTLFLAYDGSLAALQIATTGTELKTILGSGAASCALTADDLQICSLGDGRVLRVDLVGGAPPVEQAIHREKVNHLCETGQGTVATSGGEVVRLVGDARVELHTAQGGLLPLICGEGDRWATAYESELWLGDGLSREVVQTGLPITAIHRFGHDWLVRAGDGWEHRGPDGRLLRPVPLPDGQILATRASIGRVILWRDDALEIHTVDGAAPPRPLPGLRGRPRATWIDDRRVAVAGGRDLQIVDVQTGRILASMTGHRGAIALLETIPARGRRPAYLLSGDHEGSLIRWDLAVLDRTEEDLVAEIHQLTGLMVHGTELALTPR